MSNPRGTSGGGAIGGAMAGAALGWSFGLDGAVAGFIFGAVAGDLFEETTMTGDQPRDDQGRFKEREWLQPRRRRDLIRRAVRRTDYRGSPGE
jgi:hypothetical protein